VAIIGIDGMEAGRTPNGADAREPPPDETVDDTPTADVAQPPVADADTNAQGGADAAVPLRCIELPDLIDPMARSDGGVRSVQTGEVWAMLDQEVGCPMPAAGFVTYGRVDGTPLVPAGRSMAVAWPGGTGSGPVTMTSTSLQCGGEPLVIPYFASVVIPFVNGCTLPPPGAYLRISMNAPTPFPNGLMLCENTCPLPPP
jgi:hypothetical protein